MIEGYNIREWFDEIRDFGAILGIRVRENTSTRSRGSSIRRKAVLAQKSNLEEWKQKVGYRKCIT